MSAAIDDDYERLVIQPVGWAWLPVWDWAQLRYTVRACVVSPWQIGAPPQPAGPDAALDAAAPLFARRVYRSAQLSATGERIAALLRESGPLSPSVIAQRLGCSRNTISSYIGNHSELFERAGWTSQRHMLYRLRED